MKKFRFIPFWAKPSTWFQSEQERKKNYIKYYFDGFDQSINLLDLDYPSKTDKESKEYKVKKLDIELTYEEITKNEHDKQLATLNNESYLDIKSELVTDKETGHKQMMFEFDYNDIFILELKRNGFQGITPEEIIDHWFTDVCRQLSGIEDF